jgi:SRSO17 transposase
MNNDFTLDTRPLSGKLKDLRPLKILLVNKTAWEPVWDYLVRTYHYLGYETMIGPRLKYLVFHKDRPIAALSYNRAALHVGVRDSFLNWTPAQKLKFLPRVVNNNRFLVLPWVRVKNLASHLLARTLKRLRQDWPRLFGTEPFLVETFIDPRYPGTCYQAANWCYLGETRGFARVGKTYIQHGKPKSVFVYLLDPAFLKIIAEDSCRHPNPLKKVGKRVPNMMLHQPDWSPDLLAKIGLDAQAVEQLGALLDEYLAYFQECYRRSEQRQHGETFVKGLLSDLDCKSIEPIALRYQGTEAVRPMQFFFQRSPFDDVKMLRLYQKRLSSLVNDPNGMITVDESDFPKKGRHSVGVSRQHCGVLGKTDNCQAGVFIGYSGSKGYGLVDRRLYLPKVWFTEEYKELRTRCGVPEEVTFATKPQLAAEMVNQVLASGDFQARWIGCDSAFGSDPKFRAALPRKYWFFADIHADQLVWRTKPQWVLPAYKGRGKRPQKLIPSPAPVPVAAIAQDPALPWKTIVLAEGAKGPIVARVKRCRVIEARDGQPGDELWLYIRQYENGRIKYALSNAPVDLPKEELDHAATLRWPIEQCFEECKSYLGMDHYEARSWNAWHRHMLFVFIAHLFTLEIRMRFKKTDHAAGLPFNRSGFYPGSGADPKGPGGIDVPFEAQFCCLPVPPEKEADASKVRIVVKVQS